MEDDSNIEVIEEFSSKMESNEFHAMNREKFKFTVLVFGTSRNIFPSFLGMGTTTMAALP